MKNFLKSIYLLLKSLSPRQINRVMMKYSKIFIWTFVVSVLLSLPIYIYYSESEYFIYAFVAELIIGVAMFFYFLGATFISAVVDIVEKAFLRRLTNTLKEHDKKQTAELLSALKKESIKLGNNTDNRLKIYKIQEDSVVLDTSAIIDGRILGVIKTGFLDNPLVITQDVIDELQHLADKADGSKRVRGRRGLDILKEIRELVGREKFKIIDYTNGDKEVDASLVRLCKEIKAKLATVDFNLNKTAKVSGVVVLNVNKLVNELKADVLPMDKLTIKLVQDGKEKGQAIGYLDDGTMVIVQDAKKYVGKEVSVIVEKLLQTDAGRLVFADLKKN